MLETWISRAKATTRLALSRGIVSDASPAAPVEAVRMRAAGPLNLPALFRIHAVGRPDELALISRGRRLTWKELDQRIDRLAHGLRKHAGLGAGDAALLVMHKTPGVSSPVRKCRARCVS